MSELEDHARAHGTIVDHTDPADIQRWVDLVHDCGRLRCPYLRLECAALDPVAAIVLCKPTQHAGDTLGEPGQYATIVGGMQHLIGPTLNPRQELWWIRTHEKRAALVPRCTNELQCPDCAEGLPCPLDTAHEAEAASLLHDRDGQLTDYRINKVIIRKGNPLGSLGRWGRMHPNVAAHVAHVAYLALRRAEEAGEHGRAESYLRYARDLGFHLVEPRLAVRAAQNLVAQGRSADAETVLLAARITPSTNPGQEMLATALNRLLSETVVQDTAPADPRYHRLRRPAGRVQVRRFTRR